LTLLCLSRIPTSFFVSSWCSVFFDVWSRQTNCPKPPQTKHGAHYFLYDAHTVNSRILPPKTIAHPLFCLHSFKPVSLFGQGCCLTATFAVNAAHVVFLELCPLIVPLTPTPNANGRPPYTTRLIRRYVYSPVSPTPPYPALHLLSCPVLTISLSPLGGVFQGDSADSRHHSIVLGFFSLHPL